MNAFRSWGLLVWLLVSAVTHTPASAQRIVVGAKDFTEQFLMAELTGQLPRATGFLGTTRVGSGIAGIRMEQELGLVDPYWEYMGTSLVTFNRATERLGPDETYARMRELDARKGLVWLSPF